MVDTIGNDLKQMQGSIFNNKEGLKMFYGIIFKRKSGEITKTVQCIAGAMLKFYGMQAVGARTDFVSFDGDTGLINCYYEGTKKGELPKIRKEMEGQKITELIDELTLARIILEMEEEKKC